MQVEITTDGPLSARFTEVERVEMRNNYLSVSEVASEFESTLPFEEVVVEVKCQGKLGIYFGGSALAAQGSLKLQMLEDHVLCEGPIFRIRSSGITVMVSKEEEEA